MTTVIANAIVVTGNADEDVLHNAAIAISEDRIASTGPTEEVGQASSASNRERSSRCRNGPPTPC